MGWINDTVAAIWSLPRSAGDVPAADDDYWYGPVANEGYAGIKVTADLALKASALYACVKVLAETLATTPVQIFKQLPDGGSEPAPNHPIDELIRYQPNQTQTAVEFWEMMMFHAVLRGTGYAEIVPGPKGAVDKLLPLHTDRVTPKVLPDGTIRFEVVNPHTLVKRVLLQEEVFRIPGLSSDGIKGLSAVDLAAEDIGLGMAADKYAARVFSNKLNIGGFLIHPGKLSLEAQRRLIQRLTEKFAGTDNSHRPLVLQGGMKFEKATMDASSAQLLEARKWQTTLIAQRFRIPLHLLGIDDQTNRSTVEEQSINFVKYTIRPWARRIEQAIRRDLITAKGFYEAKFNLDALERGNTEARSKYWSAALGSGGSPPWMTQNEVRVREGMNRRPETWADELPRGTNPAGTPAPAPKTGTSEPEPRQAILDAAKSLVRKEVSALRRLAVRHADDREAFRKAVEAFYGGFASEVASRLGVSKGEARTWCRNRASRIAGANDINGAINAIEDEGDDVSRTNESEPQAEKQDKVEDPPKQPTLSETVVSVLKAMPQPNINLTVHLPKKGAEVTTVTKHDAKGRIAEFERREVDEE